MTFIDILSSKIKSRTQGGILNLITSSCFILTTIHSYFRSCDELVIGCSICLMTSWLYHGSRTIVIFHQEKEKKEENTPYYLKLCIYISPFFRLVDMIFCQFCIIYFTYQCASFNWLYIGTIMAIIYLLLMYYVFEKSKQKLDGDLWHCTLHIIANLGISCLIESCLDLPFCMISNK
jgi:cytochrome bd-type quinol oxidase subunit 2